MSRRWAHVILGIVGITFVVGVVEVSFELTSLLPDEILRLAAVILSGVTIGAILAGLRQANGISADPDDTHTDRSRQSARIARQDIDDHEGDNS